MTLLLSRTRLVALGALLTLASGAVAADSRPVRHPFNAGFLRLQIHDRVTDRTMHVNVWYPSVAPETPLELGSYRISAAFEGEPVGGRFGLVVISHGSGGNELGHRSTAADLARRGYVVAAPRHPKNNSEDNSGRGSREVLWGRPQQVTEVIDTLLGHPQLGSRIESARIGLIGFSAGGYTALTLIGAEPDLRHVATHCRRHRDQDRFCQTGSFWLALRTLVDITREALFGKPAAWANLHDRRVKAAVLMAPVGALFGDASFEKVKVPVRLYRAERDEELSFPFHSERVRRNLSVEPEYVVIRGAGHYAFLNSLPEPLRETLPELAHDPPGFDRAPMHEQLSGEIVDFFDRVLIGDEP